MNYFIKGCPKSMSYEYIKIAEPLSCLYKPRAVKTKKVVLKLGKKKLRGYCHLLSLCVSVVCRSKEDLM